MSALLILLVLAAMTLVGSRAAAHFQPTTHGLRLVSAALPFCVVVAALLMAWVLTGCGIADTCSPEDCKKCDVTTDAAAPIIYGYIALVGVGWLASVVEGFGGKRARQAQLLKLAAAAALAVPILVVVALVLYRVS
jgi:hypothetical protein